jgi:hypothetical protein
MPKNRNSHKVTVRIDYQDYLTLRNLAKENKEKGRMAALYPHYWNEILRRIVRDRCDDIRGDREQKVQPPKEAR